MKRAALAVVLLLAGCEGVGGPSLVSGQTPPNTNAIGPQPAGSLPAGAAGMGGGPLATHPNLLGVTFGRR